MCFIPLSTPWYFFLWHKLFCGSLCHCYPPLSRCHGCPIAYSCVRKLGGLDSTCEENLEEILEDNGEDSTRRCW